jgi:hypothetical protein
VAEISLDKRGLEIRQWKHREVLEYQRTRTISMVRSFFKSEVAYSIPVCEVLLILCALPFVLRFELERSAQSLFAINISAADIAIWCAISCHALNTCRKHFSLFLRPHLLVSELASCVRSSPMIVVKSDLALFAIVNLLSSISAGVKGSQFFDLIQCFDYYILFYWLALNALETTN